jgi:hypothetical protein
MKRRLFLCLILVISSQFYCQMVFGQMLSTDESIEVLSSGNQSVEVINSIAQDQFSLSELEQANLLKEKGVSDANIVAVLFAHAKLTEEDMSKLIMYQEKGYSSSIIEKSIAEKPKFKDSAMKYSTSEKSDDLHADTSDERYRSRYQRREDPKESYRLPRDPANQKITLTETIEVREIKAADAMEGGVSWMTGVLDPGTEIFKISETEFEAKARLSLDERYIISSGKRMLDPHIVFSVRFSCSDDGYQYVFTDFIHSYIRGSGSKYLVCELEELQRVLVGLIHEEINRGLVQMVESLNREIKKRNDEW